MLVAKKFLVQSKNIHAKRERITNKVEQNANLHPKFKKESFKNNKL